MKLHEDDERRVKKIALTVGLCAVLMASAESAMTKDTQSSQEVIIDEVTPSIFGAGAKIVIKGSGFLTEDTVSLGALELEDLKIKPTSIHAAIPTQAKRGNKLTVKRGKKRAATFTTFTFAKAPILRRAKPPFGVPGGQMKILGANLESIDQLKVNKTTIEIETKEKRSLTFTIPKGLVSGTLSVSGPGGAATLKKTFEVFYPPEIKKVDPKAAFPGDVVHITGKHFDTKGITFRIGKKRVKPDEITDTKATFVVPKNAKTGVITAKARNETAESKTELTVYPVPMLAGAPRMVASPGTIRVRGKNLDVIEQWTINGKTLHPDTTDTKSSARMVQLTIPEDLIAEGSVTATYKSRTFSAKKSTKIAAAPQIRAVRFAPSAAGCEYTVIGKHFNNDTAFKLGRKKLTPSSFSDKDAVLEVKGECESKYNRLSAKNDNVSGNTLKFNPNAGGYTATPEETLAGLTSGAADYASAQILSDLELIKNRFKGTSKNYTAKGQAAGQSDEYRAEVDAISTDLGDALVRLALAEEALCAAMSSGKSAAAANAPHGEVLDNVVKTKKHLMQTVLIPLWSNLPKAAMTKDKGVHLNTVDDKVIQISAAKKQSKTCTDKYYGKKVVAKAWKVAKTDLSALHEEALLGALNNLALKNKNSVIGEKDLNDALYSFDSKRRSYWVTKSKQASSKVQKSAKKSVGKGAGKSKKVQKSTKQKPKGKTGKGKTGKGKTGKGK